MFPRKTKTVVESSKSRIDHDQLFKQLFELFIVETIAAFTPEMAALVEKPSLFPLDKEILTDILGSRKRRVDFLVRCKVKETDSFLLFHFEHQAQTQKEFCQRMFLYFCLIYQKYRIPIYPVVIFSHDKTTQEPDHFMLTMPDGMKVFDFHYRVIQLRKLSWHDYLKTTNPVTCVLMTKMGFKKEERVQVKLECLRLLCTLKLDWKKLHFLTGFIDTYLRLSADEELRFTQEADKLGTDEEKRGVMELTTSWKEEGLKIGRREGRQESCRENVLAALEVRFGEVPKSLKKRLRAIEDMQVLRRLHRQAILAKALADFEAALN